MGAFGPKRVALTDDGQPTPPPAKLIENEGSILDLTDLVFIDPVSTGFSRAADEKNAKQFHGVQEDLNSVGEFIRLWVTRNDRWGSPKYLAGESYGTTRAAAEYSTSTGPLTTTTLCPSASAASASARPIRPLEAFVRYRTGSINCRVGPEVIRIRATESTHHNGTTDTKNRFFIFRCARCAVVVKSDIYFNKRSIAD